MALLTHDQWVADVAGRYVDVDGSFGGQCWDTFADYCIRVLGINPINTHGGKWHGWAYAIWDQYETNGAKAYFDKISPNQPARKGDTVIWTDKHWYYPASHIAVVQGDAGLDVDCISQNSSAAQPWLPGYNMDATGPNIHQRLTKQGLAGYLRPKSDTASILPVSSITIPEEEDDMPSFSERILDTIDGQKASLNELLNSIDRKQNQQGAVLSTLASALDQNLKVTAGILATRIPDPSDPKKAYTIADYIVWGATNAKNAAGNSGKAMQNTSTEALTAAVREGAASVSAVDISKQLTITAKES